MTLNTHIECQLAPIRQRRDSPHLIVGNLFFLTRAVNFGNRLFQQLLTPGLLHSL